MCILIMSAYTKIKIRYISHSYALVLNILLLLMISNLNNKKTIQNNGFDIGVTIIK